MYNGEVCRPWLNVTMLEYTSSPRFIDDSFGLNGTEKVIAEFMKAIDRIDEDQKRCKRLLKVLLCLYVLPPCNDKNEPYNYCREDCEALFADCNHAMREMLGAAKYVLKQLGLEFAHIGVPDCAKLLFTYQYTAMNETCIHWGLFGKFTSFGPLFSIVPDFSMQLSSRITCMFQSVVCTITCLIYVMFSLDVTAAMLVYTTNPPGIELYYHANVYFVSVENQGY